jgi:hypothetical protein
MILKKYASKHCIVLPNSKHTDLKNLTKLTTVVGIWVILFSSAALWFFFFFFLVESFVVACVTWNSNFSQWLL